jgi:DNA-binding transcriptional regulator YiaG
VWSLCEEKRTQELKACEVLCTPCHREVTLRSGVLHRNAKLRPADVEYIREHASSVRPAELATEFGVTPQTIRDVIAGRTWRVLPDVHLGEAA